MAYCSMCGIRIPDGQETCSMCYGDPGHGSDGYYQAWLDEQQRKQAEEQELERNQEREQEEVSNG